MQAKGFWVDKMYAHKRALHNDGTEVGRVGDTICMMCSKEDHELIEEIRQEKANKSLGIAGKSQLEEKQFQGNAKAAGLTPIIDEVSASSRVGVEEIIEAVKQTQT
jgi:hypothetical protein